MSILPPREYATDDEKRLAEALSKKGEEMLQMVDAACRLRTAPGDAKRHRQYMRASLERAANNGMDALAHSLHARKGASSE